MTDCFELVKEFHAKFGLAYDGPPRDIEPFELSVTRVDHLDEELGEYMRAWQDRNLEKMLDALVDLVYVACGTAALHGFDFNEAFERVHRANMLKVRSDSASETGRGHRWDVVKPEGWEPADLSDLVSKGAQDDDQ